MYGLLGTIVPVLIAVCGLSERNQLPRAAFHKHPEHEAQER